MPGNPLENASLARNKSGYYEIKWSEYDETASRWRSRTYSCRTKDRAIAEDVMRVWLAAANQTAGLTAGSTVSDLIDVYRTGHLELDGVSASQGFALVPVERVLGNDTLGDLTQLRVAQYRKQRSRHVADGTIRRELGALRAVLNWCMKMGELPADTKLPYIALPPASQPRENYLDVAEEARLWDVASGIALGDAPFRVRRIGYFVCLALETAARSAAVEGLTWDRVDMVRGVIDFREAGKKLSKKRRVPVPVSKRLRPVLEDLFTRRDPVKPHVLGGSGSTRKSFERLREAHGFDGLTRHDLRRTWATLRAQRGVSLYDIAGVLGDNYETVAKHYAHHAPDHLRSAVDG